MTTSADIWRKHLKPNEHIVWSSTISPAVRKAEEARLRRNTAFFAVASGGLAVLTGYRFFETVVIGGSNTLSTAFTALVTLAFSIGLAILCVVMVRKLGQLPPSAADHYAITDQRLLALDRTGVIVDEILGADVAGVILDNDRKPTELHVMRRNSEDELFFIEHLSDLPAMKARIERQFLTTEEAAS